MRRLLLILFFFSLFNSCIWAEEKLVYQVISNTSKEIYSFNPLSKEIKLLYLDECHRISPEILTSKNQVFAPASPSGMKRLDKEHHHNAYYFLALSMDGSNRFRKLFEFERGYGSVDFTNATGDKIGIKYERIFKIIDIKTGKIVEGPSATPFPKGYDYEIDTMGFLPDSKTIFLNIMYSKHKVKKSESKEKYDHRKAYVVRENKSYELPYSKSSFPHKEGYKEGSQKDWGLIGGLPDGSLVFNDVKLHGKDKCNFLYLMNPKDGSLKEIPINKNGTINKFKISHSGRFIAFQQDFLHPVDLLCYYMGWVKDLKTMSEIKVFSPSTESLKTAQISGWLDN